MKQIMGYVLSPVVAEVEAKTVKEAVDIISAELKKQKFDITITQIGEDTFIPSPELIAEEIPTVVPDFFEEIHDERKPEKKAKSKKDTSDNRISMRVISFDDDGTPRCATATSDGKGPVMMEGDVDRFEDIFKTLLGGDLPNIKKYCAETKDACTGKCSGKCSGKCTGKCTKDTCINDVTKLKVKKVKNNKVKTDKKVNKVKKQPIDPAAFEKFFAELTKHIG